MYEAFAIIFSIAAVLNYVNYKFIKLPTTIGLLLMALGIAISVFLLKPVFPTLYSSLCELLLSSNFSAIVLDIFLGFLLFAGAIHVNLEDLSKEKWSVLLFTTIGVLLSTFIIGGSVYMVSSWLSCPIPLMHCLIFGSLISPTDPIAVLALFKSSNVSKSLRLKIEGESLFNDGIGVIIFTAFLLIENSGAGNSSEPLTNQILVLFAEEVILGMVLGIVLAIVSFKMIRSIDNNNHLTIIISLAVVLGGYGLASYLKTSGPLAMVVAGLYLGHKIHRKGFNISIQKSIKGFWSILDDSFNGVLFVIVGLVLHLINFSSNLLLLAGFTIVIVLLARFISVIIPYSLIKHKEHNWVDTTFLLTWGGLRGAISLALVFSLDDSTSGDALEVLTYSVVIFSIVVQGLSIGKFSSYLKSAK